MQILALNPTFPSTRAVLCTLGSSPLTLQQAIQSVRRDLEASISAFDFEANPSVRRKRLEAQAEVGDGMGWARLANGNVASPHVVVFLLSNCT